jgi:hypothetical protein
MMEGCTNQGIFLARPKEKSLTSFPVVEGTSQPPRLLQKRLILLDFDNGYGLVSYEKAGHWRETTGQHYGVLLHNESVKGASYFSRDT